MTDSTSLPPLLVIGGGLAGSEAAWQIARAGVPVRLQEMRPRRGTDAHQTDGLAELVCSNSFRSDDSQSNAVGLLHEEMRPSRLADHGGRRCQSLAGGGRAGRRPRRLLGRGDKAFGGRAPGDHPARGSEQLAAARGRQCHHRHRPLHSPALAAAIGARTGESQLAFFDAIAPIVYKRLHRLFRRLVSVPLRQGRRRRLHQLPAGRGPVRGLHQALLEGEKTQFKAWEAEDTPTSKAACPSR